jgi:hypothetical protein
MKGEYFGIRPVKMPNRMLRWPADLVDRLARGEPLTADPTTRRRAAA